MLELKKLKITGFKVWLKKKLQKKAIQAKFKYVVRLTPHNC